MTTYTYNDILSVDIATWNEAGDNMLSGIHYDVANSEMSDKDICHCRWDEDGSLLIVCFDNSLSEEDEGLLDEIVSGNST